MRCEFSGMVKSTRDSYLHRRVAENEENPIKNLRDLCVSAVNDKPHSMQAAQKLIDGGVDGGGFFNT